MGPRRVLAHACQNGYDCIMRKLHDLWAGNLPLDDAFWTWGVTVGLLVNIVSSLLFLALITLDHPWPALFVGYGLSVPYNVVAVVGVWRSAARYEGDAQNAALARAAILVLMAVASVT